MPFLRNIWVTPFADFPPLTSQTVLSIDTILIKWCDYQKQFSGYGACWPVLGVYWLIDLGITSQNIYGYERRRRIGLRKILPCSLSFNTRRNLGTRRPRLNFCCGSRRVWAFFAPTTLLTPSAVNLTRNKKFSSRIRCQPSYQSRFS